MDWLAGAWPPVAPFEGATLYIGFIGCVYFVLGSTPVAVLVIQTALGSLLCWVVYDVARMLFDSPASMLFKNSLIKVCARCLVKLSLKWDFES